MNHYLPRMGLYLPRMNQLNCISVRLWPLIIIAVSTIEAAGDSSIIIIIPYRRKNINKVLRTNSTIKGLFSIFNAGFISKLF